MMPLMASPSFFYYASDCLECAGRINDARVAIAAAKELIDDEAYGCDVSEEMERDIRDTHERLGPMQGPDGGLPPDATTV